MQKVKRYFILFVIIVIICLSGYLFLNLMDEFLDIVIVFKKDLEAKFIVFLIFSFLISISGILSFVFNWKVLKSKTTLNDSELLDSEEKTIQKHSGFLYISYYIFGLLLFTYGLFFIYQIIIESSNRSEVNVDELFFIITVAILVIGALFNRDARKL